MNSQDTPIERAKDNAIEIASMVIFGLGFAALFLGIDYFWIIFGFGFLIFVPIIALLFGDETDRAKWWEGRWGEDWDDDWMGDWWGPSTGNETGSVSDDASRQTGSESDGQDSLSIIRRRYAHGELTDAQFERKLEQLLKTENLEDVEDHYRSQDRLYECE